MANKVLVVAVCQVVDQVCEGSCVTGEFSRFNNIKDAAQSLTDIVSEAFSHFAFFFVHLINVFSKNKHVFSTAFFCNFDIGAVHGANNQATIHHKLHVRCSRSFSACC